jgi:hypothetical protein
MRDVSAQTGAADLQELERAGRDVARLIWHDDDIRVGMVDPRHPVFSRAVVDEFSAELSRTPRILRKVMNRASSAAEDLNVEPFQGLIEVIQNADDLRASEVRFALRKTPGLHQLLVVHDGDPVTYAHVLAMTLPFLTTKEDDAAQKGRFGIGLKTLARISSGLAVHSSPYHFSARHLSISNIDPEASLAGFYEPKKDTLLVLDLNSGFNESELESWFEQWSDDGLIFLSTVHRFRWCSVIGETLIEKAVRASAWKGAAFSSELPGIERLRCREVAGASAAWTVFSADVRVSDNLSRAHKATGESTPVSIAISSNNEPGALYIAFKTRIPCSLAISIDAQFDPSTAREDLIDNAWNRWLVERCSEVVRAVAMGLLKHDPPAAWNVIPISGETLGSMPGRWPYAQFKEAFEGLRESVGLAGLISMAGHLVPLRETAYEDSHLKGLLTTADIELLAPGRKAIRPQVRGATERWREVLNELRVSEEVGTGHLLKGFTESAFGSKPMAWWVDAGFRITSHHSVEGIFGVPFLRAADGRPVTCSQNDTTRRPLVFGDKVSAFCERWSLLDRLHDAYGASQAGEGVRNWLVKYAAYTISPDAEIEIAAFAEKFANQPIELSETDLRELRDRFGWLSERRAMILGPLVGGAILLNGSAFHKDDRKRPRKISPRSAYLPKTLDPEHPDWPEAAADLPGLTWLSAQYDDHLKLSGGRNARRRDENFIYRGPRRFLMLLGAECAPRLIGTGRRRGAHPTRSQQLLKAGADGVQYDFRSPDLELLLAALPRLSRRERRLRSAALMRTLSRHWDRVYRHSREVLAQHEARKYYYNRGNVTADWLCLLRDTPWVAVSNGDLRAPGAAVIRNPQTETLYEAKSFVSGLEGVDLSSEFASSLGLITDVRASDLVAKLEAIRSNGDQKDVAGILQIFRTLSKLCPKQELLFGDVGDISQTDFRRMFSDGGGLICLRPGEWKRPSDLFSGRDVFHRPELFVPAAPAYADLWRVLQIRAPELGDCSRFCRQLAGQPYSTSLDAVLMDLYRYMDGLLQKAERAKNRLATLPLACAGQWVSRRPVYLIEDRELRGQLAKTLPNCDFWSPPCEVRDLPHLAEALGIESIEPKLELIANRKNAQDEGENTRDRFQAAVEHLSTGLARNEPDIREKLQIAWDELRDVPLFVYTSPFAVEAFDPSLSPDSIHVSMRALLTRSPLELHVWTEGLQLRDSGGRAIASLFPPNVQRRIEAEWVASWAESKEQPIEMMRLAADEEKRESQLAAAQELADQIQASETGKIAVSPPASRTSAANPRRLKSFQGGVSGAVVQIGAPSNPSPTSQTIPLATQAPPLSSWPSSSSSPAPVEYSTEDLEHRGWEILLAALKSHDGPQLQDFRRRRGVGADGTIDWKTFIELKASGRSIPNSIEMTNSEYERAKEKGEDYILALVYGLEEGQRTEARLIFDPANSLTLKPVNGIRLIGLSEATALVLQFSHG